MSERVQKSNRLYVAEKPSPRLWLAPIPMNKSLVQPTAPQPQERAAFLFLKAR